MDGGKGDYGFRNLLQFLIIFGQATPPAKPPECSFDDPSAGSHDEAGGSGDPSVDDKRQVEQKAGEQDRDPIVDAVGEDDFEPAVQVLDLFHQIPSAGGVLDVGGMDEDTKQEAGGIALVMALTETHPDAAAFTALRCRAQCHSRYLAHQARPLRPTDRREREDRWTVEQLLQLGVETEGRIRCGKQISAEVFTTHSSFSRISWCDGIVPVRMKGVALDVKCGYVIEVKLGILPTDLDVDFVFTRHGVSLGRGANQLYDGQAID